MQLRSRHSVGSTREPRRVERARHPSVLLHAGPAVDLDNVTLGGEGHPLEARDERMQDDGADEQQYTEPPVAPGHGSDDNGDYVILWRLAESVARYYRDLPVRIGGAGVTNL